MEQAVFSLLTAIAKALVKIIIEVTLKHFFSSDKGKTAPQPRDGSDEIS